MNILGPTRHPRLNEGIGFVFLALGICIILSLVSITRRISPGIPSEHRSSR